jgi:hypothetical protein
MTLARRRAALSIAPPGIAYHVIFQLLGRPEHAPLRDDGPTTMSERAPARVRSVARALRDLGQRVSFIESVANAVASRREVCDILIVVPVGSSGPQVSDGAAVSARRRILWVDRIDAIDATDPAAFDYVYVAWAHLRPAVLAWSGLASDRVLTTGLAVSEPVPAAPTPTAARDSHRVTLLTGSEPALPMATEILRALRRHDSRFSVEILGEPDAADVSPSAIRAGVPARAPRSEGERSDTSAKAGILVVTRSAAERDADVVIRARKAGLVVVAPAGGTASELVFPEYDGVLLDEDSASSAFPEACATAVRQLCDDTQRAERLRARAMSEPLSWHAIAREWVAHWERLDRTASTQIAARVGVVMAVYNEARYIEQAVESILSQTVWDLELIVVNDGSTDETRDVLRRCRDARVRVIDQDNTGVWAALNRGLRDVRSSLVARMDGDDVSHPRRLQYQLDFLEAHPAVALAGCACYKIGASGQILSLYDVPTGDAAIKRRLAYYSQFVHPSVVMRRPALERVGGYRHHEAEDYDLFLRISERFDVANLDRPLHRLRRTGLTRVARFEREIVASVKRCAELARRRGIEGIDPESAAGPRRRPMLGLPLADLRWAERRPYARTLHAVAEAMLETDRPGAVRLLAKAVILAPEIPEHWRSWIRASLGYR